MRADDDEGLRPVVFHQVAEWEQDREPGEGWAWTVFVWLAFDDRLVATGQSMGKESHAGVWAADAFLEAWPDRVMGTPAAWLQGHVERFARGADVRDAVLADYAARHGGREPPTTRWPLRH